MVDRGEALFWNAWASARDCGIWRRSITPRTFVRKGSSSLLRVTFAGILLGMGFVVFGGEPIAPPVPAIVTDPAPDDVPKPKIPPDSVSNPTVAPHPATFTDYLPTSDLFLSPIRTVYPVVENKTSAVANQLVRNSSNESIFVQGAGPRQAPLDAIPLGEDVPFLHNGPLAFRTSMGFENFLNDNFFGSPTHARTSWLRNYTPGFTMSYTPNGQTSVNAFYNATLHDFSSSVERDYYDESGGVSITVKHFGVDGLSFNISDLYNQIGNTIVNPLSSTFDVNNLEFQTGTRYATNSLPVSFRYNSGALSLEGSYAYDVVDYFGQLHEENDAQQHTGTIRGAYDVSPGNLSVFGESNFQYTRHPSAGLKDFDFLNVFAGLRGRFDNVTYMVKVGGCAFDALGTGTTTGRPVLATEARYDYSPRLSVTVFGTRSIETGVLTGGSKVDSYGAAINIKPMMQGQLSLSHVWQDSFRLTGANQLIETTELQYKHKILGWMEPRLGMKYSIRGDGAKSNDTIWTGLAGIAFKVQARGFADVDYYHEDTVGPTRRQITDRWSTGYTHKINMFAKATFGFEHALRRESDLHGHVRIEELRFGINMTW